MAEMNFIELNIIGNEAINGMSNCFGLFFTVIDSSGNGAQKRKFRLN